jgi:hypothetical protein
MARLSHSLGDTAVIVSERERVGLPPPYAEGVARLPAVRMAMTAHLAAALADHLLDIRGSRREEALCEQLWLRAVLVEQRRRTVMVERSSFDARADRLLAALDPTPDFATSRDPGGGAPKAS